MIRVKDVQKRYGEQVVLDGVTFDVEGGSITTIIGRSGQGKSVLLKHIMGLESPDSGSIVINGEEIVGMKTRDLNRIRKCFGFLFQDGALFDSLSVKDNVAFPLREHTKLTENEIMDVVSDKLGEVGMSGHAEKLPSEISGGMRKRVGLARALALDPDIVFFDEPTSGLDPITKGAIYGLISKTHIERSVTYVLVSHDIQGVLEVSDKIMLLFDGKIRKEGTPDEIRTSSDPVIRQFISGSPDGPIPID